jgi:hypothetical protein
MVAAIFYFTQSMAWWLENAHHEVWETTFALTEPCSIGDEFSCWRSWYVTAKTATVLLQYAEEFISQSDEYSITE